MSWGMLMPMDMPRPCTPSPSPDVTDATFQFKWNGPWHEMTAALERAVGSDESGVDRIEMSEACLRMYAVGLSLNPFENHVDASFQGIPICVVGGDWGGDTEDQFRVIRDIGVC